jgi:hypothetical protein
MFFTSSTDMAAHVEELLGSDGSRLDAELLLHYLFEEGFVAFDSERVGWMLADVPEGEWGELVAKVCELPTTCQVRIDGEWLYESDPAWWVPLHDRPDPRTHHQVAQDVLDMHRGELDDSADAARVVIVDWDGPGFVVVAEVTAGDN